MERGVKDSDRVLVICTDSYVRKANDREGGRWLRTADCNCTLLTKYGTDKFTP